MTQRAELEIGDSHNDTVQLIKSEITGNVYVSVNKGMQVRLEGPEQKQVLDFFTKAADQPVTVTDSDAGLFYLIRQRRDNPLKLKVMFANTASAKMFTSRASANEHKDRMDRQHGTKFKFFVVKEVK